ncbi:MAG TPA: DUF3006 domain-containing protein [Anaerolineae bacterium]|nr:DUF3006 domain-containing protein [Anaerolineae bacterium]
MPGKSKSRKRTKGAVTELRGAIDQIEGDVVVVVFDNGQRLDWPRRFVPEGAKPGDAVIVKVVPADDAHWSGQAETGQITLGEQALQWPGQIDDGPRALSIEVDAEDTAARKERVRGLVDDIFKKK